MMILTTKVVIYLFLCVQDVFTGKIPRFSIDSSLKFLSKAAFYHSMTSGIKVNELLKEASLQDSSDCAKKLLCSLASMNPEDRAWDENKVIQVISSELSYASESIQLDLAANLGRKNPDQCYSVYSRCQFDKNELMDILRRRGVSLNIPTTEDLECTVIFLWTNSKNSLPSDVIQANLLPKQ